MIPKECKRLAEVDLPTTKGRLHSADSVTRLLMA